MQPRVLLVLNVEDGDASRLLSVLPRPALLRVDLAVLRLLHLAALQVVHLERLPSAEAESVEDNGALWTGYENTPETRWYYVLYVLKLIMYNTGAYYLTVSKYY